MDFRAKDDAVFLLFKMAHKVPTNSLKNHRKCFLRLVSLFSLINLLYEHIVKQNYIYCSLVVVFEYGDTVFYHSV